MALENNKNMSKESSITLAQKMSAVFNDELVKNLEKQLNAVNTFKDQMESQSWESTKQNVKSWTKVHKDLTALAKDLESRLKELKDGQADKPQQQEPKVAKLAENNEATFDDKRYKHLQTMNKLSALSPKQEKELRELDKQYKEMQTAKQEARAELREKFKSIRESFNRGSFTIKDTKAEVEQKTAETKTAETKTENTVTDKIGDGVKTTANFAGNVIKNILPYGVVKLFDDTEKRQEAQNEKEKFEAQREEKANNVLDKLGLGAVNTTGVELLSKMKESVTNDDKAKAEVAQQATQQQENTEQMKMVMR